MQSCAVNLNTRWKALHHVFVLVLVVSSISWIEGNLGMSIPDMDTCVFLSILLIWPFLAYAVTMGTKRRTVLCTALVVVTF